MPNMNADQAARPWWEELSVHSDRADVWEEIGELIRKGKVRVRPLPGDPERVEVIPVEPPSAKKRLAAVRVVSGGS